MLFISGDPGGGSFRSTLELARRLAGRGHEVGLLARDRKGSRLTPLHRRLVNAATKLEGTPLSGPLWYGASWFGRRPRAATEVDGVTIWRATQLQNTFSTLRPQFRPEVVVCSSIGRVGWRQIRRECAEHAIPSVLYMREESSIGHLAVPHSVPNLLLANASAHTARAAEFGVEAVTIPSVISLDAYRIASSRERVLYINPVPSQGLATALALAAACPDILFAFAESWVLDDDARHALLQQLRNLHNVEFRPRVEDPARLYGDARVLLAPYLYDGRPRVVLEAQTAGIPVLASNLSAIAEVVGPGGVLVAADAPVDDWARALHHMLEPDAYAGLSAAAVAHAHRPEVDPEHLVTHFEDTMQELVRRHAVVGDGDRS